MIGWRARGRFPCKRFSRCDPLRRVQRLVPGGADDEGVGARPLRHAATAAAVSASDVTGVSGRSSVLGRHPSRADTRRARRRRFAALNRTGCHDGPVVCPSVCPGRARERKSREIGAAKRSSAKHRKRLHLRGLQHNCKSFNDLPERPFASPSLSANLFLPKH